MEKTSTLTLKKNTVTFGEDLHSQRDRKHERQGQRDLENN